jgi:myo-inositol-1-phosphate synthase
MIRPNGRPTVKTLREWRETRGISYRELAERAGVARWTVTRIESGRFSRVNRTTMRSIVDALGVEPHQVTEFAEASDRASAKHDVLEPKRRSRVQSNNGPISRRRRDDGKVRVAIIGVGNCASSLVQGVHYYRDASVEDFVPGLMHVDLGGYHVRDIEFTAAFDIDAGKVGKDLSQAIFTEPNNTIKFADVPNLGVPVHRGMTHDGLGKYLSEIITKAPGATADVAGILRDTETDVVISYLPVGSEMATKWYVEQILDAGCAFVNCIPVFIAKSEYWQKRFVDRGVPIVGDDIKSQVGATITHRVLTRLFADRGVRIDRTYQLNFGGNTDFLNMLERERLQSKKISKTNAVTSQMDYLLPSADVHVGPSDYVPWLQDRKWCHIRIEGTTFGDVPLNMELKLEVWDSPNSAGVVIDAVRCAKLALDNSISGPLYAPASYFMKSPPEQYHDDIARDRLDEFIQIYNPNRPKSAVATAETLASP